MGQNQTAGVEAAKAYLQRLRLTTRLSRGAERLQYASILIPACLLAIWAFYDLNSLQRSTRQTALDRSFIASSYVQRVLQAQETVLELMDQLIRDKSLEEIQTSRELQEHLIDLDRRTPFTAVVAIVGPDGRVAASSLPSANGTDVSDREHIAAIRAGHKNIYVGPRQILANSKIDTLVVAKASQLGPQGVILLAPIPVAIIAEFFAAHAPHPQYVASLLRDDGWLLIRRDPAQPALRISPSEPALVAISGASSGVYSSRATSDGIDRIYAFTRVGSLPFVVNYGVAQNLIRNEVLLRLTTVGVVLGLVAALGWALSTQSVREARLADQQRAELEEKVAARTLDLTHIVEQKDLLIREVHHRIKNNLAMVSTLLRLQSRSEPILQQAANEAIGRIESIAELHSTFYQGADVKEVNFGTLLEKIVSNIVGSTGTTIEFRLKADDSVIDLDRATRMALVCNEIIMNALKHAFPDGKGVIDIDCRRSGSNLILQIADNGIGAVSQKGATGLGMQLIRSFSDQLGRWSLEGTEGTRYRLEITAMHAVVV